MIVRGKLHEISSGFRKTKSTSTKYDYVEIGDTTVRNLTIDSYLGDRLSKLVGEDIEMSILKPKVLLPKTLSAIRTADGTVYRNENQSKFLSGPVAYLIVGAVSLAWLIIPYTILFFTLGSFSNNFGRSSGGLLMFFIIGHVFVTIGLSNMMKKSYDAFGKENAGRKVV